MARVTWRKRLSLLAAMLTCALVLYEVRHARALGIPTLTPLTYTGSLLTFGSPDNTVHTMTLALFVAGANDGGLGSAACTTTLSVTCVNGQFTIPLSSTCLAVIQANPNVQSELTVDNIPMGLASITAVPYAVEAGTAASVSATSLTGILPIGNGGTGSSTQNFVDLTTNQSIGGAKDFTGSVGIGTSSPAAPLDVQGTIHASQFGTIAQSSACPGTSWSASCATNQPGTGVLSPGASISFDINSFSLTGGNVGLVTIFLGYDPATATSNTDNGWVVGINSHGGGYNQYVTLASRTSTSYPISFSAITTFTNNTSSNARYIIREVPLAWNNPTMNGQ